MSTYTVCLLGVQCYGGVVLTLSLGDGDNDSDDDGNDDGDGDGDGDIASLSCNIPTLFY